MTRRVRGTASLLVFAAFAWATHATAEPRLPSLFSDHMVLQRGRAIPVWGMADPGEAITVTLGSIARDTKAGADGRWRVDLPPHDAGGPLTLVVKGRNWATWKGCPRPRSGRTTGNAPHRRRPADTVDGTRTSWDGRFPQE